MLSLMFWHIHTHTHTHTYTPSYSSRYQIIKHWTPRAAWKTDMHDARSDVEPSDGQKPLRDTSSATFAVLSLYRVKFITAPFPHLQLWHLH